MTNQYSFESSGEIFDVPKKPNGKALAALILGILSILLCWTGPVGLIIGIVGIVLSVLGLKAVANSDPRTARRGMAIAGVILSVIGILLGILFTVIYYWAFGHVKNVQESCGQYEVTSTEYTECVHNEFGLTPTTAPTEAH
ncbi:MAG: DUF4190 domain-containing protein [Corynebacterium sp.]|nr:DUF4190 domain-containing protein [Corynebacterium sp.]